jgi:hypothetical protein
MFEDTKCEQSPHKERSYIMKKLMIMALGLGLALGSVSFAQDAGKMDDTKKSEKKKGKKKDKKSDTKTDDKKM